MWTILFGAFVDTSVVEVAVTVENPDDAAEGNKGTEVITPWQCIFHGQFDNPGIGMPSGLIFLALSCQMDFHVLTSRL